MELNFYEITNPNVTYESYTISDLYPIPRVGEFCKFDENNFRVKEIMWDLNDKIIHIGILK